MEILSMSHLCLLFYHLYLAPSVILFYFHIFNILEASGSITIAILDQGHGFSY